MQSVHYLEAEVLGPCTRALESETVCRYVQLLYLLSAFYFKFYRRCIVLFRNTQKLCIKSKCVFMLYFTGCNQAGDERKSERLEHGEYLYQQQKSNTFYLVENKDVHGKAYRHFLYTVNAAYTAWLGAKSSHDRKMNCRLAGQLSYTQSAE